MARTAIARKFYVLFKKALTDQAGKHKKTMKEKEADYQKLTFFIHGLKRKQEFSACLDEYLNIYKEYSRTDRRSTFVFTILLKSIIEKTNENDRYIDELSDALAETKPPFSKIRDRYEDLEVALKNEIQGLLKDKLLVQKLGTGILFVLRKAYYKEHKKEPSPQELSSYDPAPDNTLEQKFKAVRDKCRNSWIKNDAEHIEDDIYAFVAFLASQKDSLKLFQVLKWCRDVVEESDVRVTRNRYGEVTQTIRPASHDALDSELYFQTAYRVFKYAIDHGFNKNYTGFTKYEIGFFFNPLSSDYWYENYANRYKTGVAKGHFKETTVLFLRLLIFARINEAEWLNNKDAKKIRDTLKTIPKKMLRQKSFLLDVGPEAFRGNVRIGDKFGKVVVVYFADNTTSGKFITVEFVGIENLLFKIDINTLSRFNVNSFYTIVWQNTRHLLKLIPWMFQLLGYVFSFITGGFSALAFDIALDIFVGEYAEAAELGPGATMALSAGTSVGVPLGMAKVGSIGNKSVDAASALDKSLNKNLSNLAGDEAKALKSVNNVLEADAKALGKTQSGTTTTHTSQRLTPSDTAVSNRTNGGANQGTGRGGGGGGRGGPSGGGSGGGPGRGGGGGTSGTIPDRPPAPDPPNFPYKVAISPDYAGELATQLMRESIPLQELYRIYRLAPARHAREIQDFMRYYTSESGLRFDIRPANHPDVNFHRLGPQFAESPTAINWGTYLPRERRFVFHEGIFSRPDILVKEVGHEVGTSELGRVWRIPKDNIPDVYHLPPPLSSLTHVIDLRLKPPDD